MDTVANIDPDIINILRTKFLKNIKVQIKKNYLLTDQTQSIFTVK